MVFSLVGCPAQRAAVVGGVRDGLRVLAELLAADHQNWASNLLASVLRHGLGVGGQIKQFALQRREVGRLLRRLGRVAHWWGPGVLTDKMIGTEGGQVLAWEFGRQGFAGLPHPSRPCPTFGFPAGILAISWLPDPPGVIALKNSGSPVTP